eukprot:scaffold165474_cov30-Tisochrysis_lutea.AAC.2
MIRRAVSEKTCGGMSIPVVVICCTYRCLRSNAHGLAFIQYFNEGVAKIMNAIWYATSYQESSRCAQPLCAPIPLRVHCPMTHTKKSTDSCHTDGPLRNGAMTCRLPARDGAPRMSQRGIPSR